MNHSSTKHPTGHAGLPRWAAAVLLPVLVLVILMLASGGGIAEPAAAAKITNQTVIAVKGKAARKALRAGVRFSPQRPAKGGARRWRLPVSSVMPLGNLIGVSHKGAIRLRAGKKRIRITGLHASIGRRSLLSGQLDRRQVDLFRIVAPARNRTIDYEAGSVELRAARLVLLPKAAKLLRSRLGRRGIKPGAFGVAKVSADVTSTGMPPLAKLDGPPTPGGAAMSARPAGAVDLVDGTVRWSPRLSWLDYLRQGEGPSAEDGASFEANAYTLPVTGGWYDEATDQAVVETSGTTRFRFIGHFIDVALADWSFDLASTPKGVSLVREAMHSIALPEPNPVGTRQPLMRLDGTPIPAPTVGGDGKTLTWRGLPATTSNEAVPIYLAYPYDSTQGSLDITVQVHPIG